MTFFGGWIKLVQVFFGVLIFAPIVSPSGLKSGVLLLGPAKIEKSSVMEREYGIGLRPFSYSVHEIKVRIDTRYAVGISCCANIAPKSNLIQLGSAHEWSGVWTKPFKRMPSRVESICTSSLAVKMERVETYSSPTAWFERAQNWISLSQAEKDPRTRVFYTRRTFFFFSGDLHGRRLKGCIYTGIKICTP